MSNLVLFAVLSVLVIVFGWQTKRFWGPEAMVAYIIGMTLGALVGFVAGQS
jgi:hypothetical protein